MTLPSSCRHGHDLTLPGAVKTVYKGARRGWAKVCWACRKEKNLHRWRRLSEARKAEKAGQPLPPPPPPPERVEKADRSPFGRSLVALERHWGIPWAKWTMAHHRAHTRVIYQMLGWPETGPTSPAFVRPSRAVLTKEAA